MAAVPAPGWAAKVFPDLPLEEAVEKLWALIFDVCRVSTGDPVTCLLYTSVSEVLQELSRGRAR